jgi:hypothetical protein
MISVYMEEGRLKVKKYFLSMLFKADFVEAFGFCKDNRMELVTLRNEAEATRFLNICSENIESFKIAKDPRAPRPEAIIGGVSGDTSIRSLWQWFESGRRIDYNIKWTIGEPNNSTNEYCLGVTSVGGKFGFNDFPCSYKLPFICQEVTFV